MALHSDKCIRKGGPSSGAIYVRNITSRSKLRMNQFWNPSKINLTLWGCWGIYKKFMGFDNLKWARRFLHQHQVNLRQVHCFVQSEFSRMRCSAAAFNFQYLSISLRPLSSWLRHPPHLSFPSIFPCIHILYSNESGVGGWVCWRLATAGQWYWTHNAYEVKSGDERGKFRFLLCMTSKSIRKWRYCSTQS